MLDLIDVVEKSSLQPTARTEPGSSFKPRVRDTGLTIESRPGFTPIATWPSLKAGFGKAVWNVARHRSRRIGMFAD